MEKRKPAAPKKILSLALFELDALYEAINRFKESREIDSESLRVNIYSTGKVTVQANFTMHVVEDITL